MLRVLALCAFLAGCGAPPRLDACSSAHFCGHAGAYWQLCTAAGGTEAYYMTSDGKRFGCASDDCTSAAGLADQWCSAQ